MVRSHLLSLSLSLALVMTALTACLGDPPPASRSPSDPANPHAREAPSLPLGPPVAVAAAAAADAAHAGGAVYTCTMHPEISHDGPGTCPKCGMTLVRKDPSP